MEAQIMGLFDKIFRRETEGTDIEVAFGLKQISNITREQALEIPAVSAAVNFIAGTIASLPIRLYNSNDEVQTAAEITADNRLYQLNEESGDTLNPTEIKRAVIRDMLLDGTGYMHIERSGNEVLALRYVRDSAVSVEKNSDAIYKTLRMLVDGRVYNPWDFVILSRNSVDGGKGVSILAENPTLLTSSYMLLQLEKAMSRRGGNKKGFLRTEQRVDDKALQKIREAWKKLYSNNGDGMMILQNGLDFKESSSTAVEMQLNQNKVTNAEQIAMLFGLSPDVLSGRADDRTYINSIRTAVLPVVSAFEMALNRALLLEKEKNSKYFVIDTSELLKADILTRYQAYQIGLAANFLQPDEIRFKENLAPLGLDFIKLGLNDVLYDPTTKQIYTPNTDSHAKIDDAGLQSGDKGGIIAEKRYNDKHDEKGLFARKDGGAIKSVTVSEDGTVTTVYKPQAKTKYAPSPQRNHSGIQVKPKTYAKLCGEFNTKYPGSRKGFQGTVFKGKYQYLATSDGEGGVIINRKIKL
jgi:HK97 family phage portal protein